MKKILLFSVAICSLFLSILLTLDVGRETYDKIFDNKRSILIDKKVEQSNYDYVDEIIRVCKENDCMIFYSSVSEASSLKPIFRIYVIPDFYNYFQLELTEKIKLKKDSFISTDYKNDSAKAKIISLPLYENIEIRSIDEIKELELNHSRFYLPSNDITKVIKAFQTLGYNIYLDNQGNQEDSISILENIVLFIVGNLVMIVSFLFYAFSKRREIVIKQINGFGNRKIFETVFRDNTGYIPISILLPYIILCFFLKKEYSAEAAYYFFETSIKYMCVYILICEVIYCMVCVSIQRKKKAIEIRGYNPERLLMIVIISVRVILCVIVFWAIANAQQYFDGLNKLRKTYENSGEFLNEYVTVSLNDSGSEISQGDDYLEKAKNFLNEVNDNFEMIIIDSSEYLDDSENGMLYISPSYFKVHEVLDNNGKLIQAEDLESDSYIYLFPDNIENETFKGVPDNVLIKKYKAGQKFYTYNSETAEETKGIVTNPVILIINDDILKWDAEYYIGMQFVFIKSKGNMYEKLEPIIKKTGMRDVILEVPLLKDVFEAAIVSVSVKLLQYDVLIIIAILSLVLIFIFEATVYYENNKRNLAIKKLNGYGLRAFENIIIVKILIIILLTIFSYCKGYSVYGVLLVMIIECIVFYVTIKKLESKEFVVYLKGDM